MHMAVLCVYRINKQRGTSFEFSMEDLQMILSLADDVDEEFMEDVTLEEAEAFEVKEVTSFLQRLSSSCEERESRLACKTRTEGGENAFKALNGHSWYCYRAKENWKKIQKKGSNLWQV